MAETTHLFNIIFKVIDHATKTLSSIDARLKKIEEVVEHTGKGFKKLKVNMLAMGLGMTFFMWGVQMQLRRVLRLMFNVFEEASGSTSLLMEKFNIMRANLGSIAIAFFDAFAQSPLFEALVNITQHLAEWFLNLTDATQAWIATGIFKGLVITMTLSFLGQTILALNTLTSIFDAPIKGWAGALGAAGLILTIGLVVDSIEDFVTGKIMKGIIDTTAAVITGYASFGLLKGVKGSGYLFAIGIALNLVGKGVFFQSIFGIVGGLLGLIKGFLKWVLSAAELIGMQVYDALIYPLVKKVFPKATKFNANPFDNEYDILSSIVGSAKGGFQTGYKIGKRWDKEVTGWMEDADKEILADEMKKNTEAIKENTNAYANYQRTNPFGSPQM